MREQRWGRDSSHAHTLKIPQLSTAFGVQKKNKKQGSKKLLLGKINGRRESNGVTQVFNATRSVETHLTCGQDCRQVIEMISALCLSIAVTIPNFKSLQTNPGNPDVKTARLRHCAADQGDF